MMYSERFLKFIPGLLKREGGSKYVNDPNDPGGATKYGISFQFLKGCSKEIADVDNDGDVDIEDIKALSEDDAVSIYYERFYKPLRCDEINCEFLALHLFDMGVNAGVSRAVKILQKVLMLKQDGIFGPITMNAVNTSSCGQCGKCYVDERIAFYEAIAAKNPRLKKFLKGWKNRVIGCKV